MTTKRFDSLIFDMDGTMWDAVDSYVDIWNCTNREFGINAVVTRPRLLEMMGKTIDVIYDNLMGDVSVDKNLYIKRLDYYETTLMPRLGGRFYQGAIEGIRRLSERYQLFMVSNCGSDGLHNMMRFGNITECFVDSLSFGETFLDKCHNIKLLMTKYKLENPLYIGDTQGDSDSAHAAGIAMCHARWGFGTCRDAELAFDSFPAMVQYLMTD